MQGDLTKIGREQQCQGCVFSCVFSGNRQVKVKVKGTGSFSFLIERGQQDGKDISHNSNTAGEGAQRHNKLYKSRRSNKDDCDTGGTGSRDN